MNKSKQAVLHRALGWWEIWLCFTQSCFTQSSVLVGDTALFYTELCAGGRYGSVLHRAVLHRALGWWEIRLCLHRALCWWEIRLCLTQSCFTQSSGLVGDTALFITELCAGGRYGSV